MAKKKYSFLETIKAFRNKKILYMFLLGAASGLPFALTLGTLQAWMTDVKIDIKTIALFAFLRLPFSLKFLWSPIMDRYVPPFLDRRRGWGVITQVALAALLVAMALTDPGSQIQVLLILTLLVNFFSASQDIVLDAYRREVLNEEELGLGIATFINGYLIAFRFISGAFALLLPKFIGWPGTYMVMAALMGAMAVVTWTAPKLITQAPAPKTIEEAFIGPLREFFGRKEALTILAFVVLYKLGDAMATTVTLPYILKLGFSKEEYVGIVKIWGLGATILGGIIGGHYTAKLGIVRSLWVMGFLQAGSVALFSILEWTGKNYFALTAIIGIENLSFQMGTAAYAAYMASVSNIQFTATQYALLTSLMAVPQTILGSRTGVLAESVGWSNFFLVCALCAAPGMFLIPILTADKISKAKNTMRIILIWLTIGAIVYAFGASLIDIGKLFTK